MFLVNQIIFWDCLSRRSIFFYVSGCGCSQYLPENLQEFLPTYLVSLEGKRRWLMEEKNSQKATNKRLSTYLLKVKIYQLQSQYPSVLQLR